MKVVRVDRDEFELEDGRSFPINPPLSKEMSIADFQRIYDATSQAVRRIQASRGVTADNPQLGEGRKDHS